MEAAAALKAAQVLKRCFTYIREWYRGPDIEVTSLRTFALYDALSGHPYKPVDSQIRVENIGSKTVYDLRGSIYFQGSMGDGENAATVTVDTRGIWEQQENASISLSGGESEWLNVLRVVQDYRAGFDPDTDVYLIFPTEKGWDQPSRIRFDWPGGPAKTQLTRDRLTHKDVGKLTWEEAQIEITGEDKDSNKVSVSYDINLSAIRDGMDNRAMFFKGST